MFAEAASAAPSLVLLEDVDSFGSSVRSLMVRWQGERVPQASGVEGSLVAQLCACLDSLLSSPVVVLSTTNRLR